MSETNVKKIYIQYVKRPQAKQGTFDSDNYNDSVDEILSDLTNLATSWNVELQPILESLPHGTTDTRWSLPSSIDPKSNGLDGSQIFMDNSATSSSDDGIYYDSSNSRPYTIKEVATNLSDDIGDLRQEVTEQLTGLSNGLSAEQWTRLGIWVRDGGSTSSSSTSTDGIARTNRTNLNNTIDDVYTAGDPPSSRLTYTVQEMLDAIAALHGGTDWSDDPSTWNHSSVSTDFTYINNFIGKAAGLDTPNYSTNYYVTDSDSLETAIGDLDTALHATDTEQGYINTFIGKSSGNETPTYSTTNYVANGDSLEVAIGKLDTAVASYAGRQQWTFSSHTNIAEPVVINHNTGVTFPLVQVIDTTVIDYTGIVIDEVYNYENEHSIATSDEFLTIQFINQNTFHVYTSATDGIIVAVF